MSQFSSLCRKYKVLRRLQSITLTLHTQPSVHWTKDVVDLLAECPLQMFHISTVSGYTKQAISDEFCSQIVAMHGHCLTRFSVHRIRISMLAIDEICRCCTKLEQLFIVISQDSFVSPCTFCNVYQFESLKYVILRILSDPAYPTPVAYLPCMLTTPSTLNLMTCQWFHVSGSWRYAEGAHGILLSLATTRMYGRLVACLRSLGTSLQSILYSG